MQTAVSTPHATPARSPQRHAGGHARISPTPPTATAPQCAPRPRWSSLHGGPAGCCQHCGAPPEASMDGAPGESRPGQMQKTFSRAAGNFALLLGYMGLCRAMVGMVRSYHGENAPSHQHWEAKHRWARLVARWGTTCETRVTICILHLAACPLPPSTHATHAGRAGHAASQPASQQARPVAEGRRARRAGSQSASGVSRGALLPPPCVRGGHAASMYLRPCASSSPRRQPGRRAAHPPHPPTQVRASWRMHVPAHHEGPGRSILAGCTQGAPWTTHPPTPGPSQPGGAGCWVGGPGRWHWACDGRPQPPCLPGGGSPGSRAISFIPEGAPRWPLMGSGRAHRLRAGSVWHGSFIPR